MPDVTIVNAATGQKTTRDFSAAEAAAVAADQAAAAIAAQTAALHASATQSLAGYVYQGVNFNLAQELTYYEAVARKAADGLLDGLYPVQLVGTDGLVEAADASAIAAAYADMEAHAMAVQIQLGNQLKALQS